MPYLIKLLTYGAYGINLSLSEFSIDKLSNNSWTIDKSTVTLSSFIFSNSAVLAYISSLHAMTFYL